MIPIGAIRRDELAALLSALGQARPDWAAPLRAVATATGIDADVIKSLSCVDYRPAVIVEARRQLER